MKTSSTSVKTIFSLVKSTFWGRGISYLASAEKVWKSGRDTSKAEVLNGFLVIVDG
jgi:hypothetical protein